MRGGGHVWNVVRDTTGRDVPIWYIASEAVRGVGIREGINVARFTGPCMVFKKKRQHIREMIGNQCRFYSITLI